MLLSQCNITDQLFEFHPDGGVPRVYNATRLLEAILSGQLKASDITVEVDESLYEQASQRNGVEREHLPNVDPSVPLVLSEVEDGTHIVVDGNHRIVAGYEKGQLEFKAFLVMDPDTVPWQVSNFFEIFGQTP